MRLLMFSIIMVLFSYQAIDCSYPPEMIVSKALIIKAIQLDQIIQSDYAEYESVQIAYNLDTIIEEGSVIADWEIEDMDIMELYVIDKSLALEKILKMKKKEQRKTLVDIIGYYAKEYGVEPNLVRAVVKKESHYELSAKSHKGALGVMQLMKRTAAWLGVEDPFHPIDNIEGGTKYLSMLLKRYKGDEKLALAAYNAGPRKVRKYKGIPPYPETIDYVKKVRKYKNEYDKQSL